MNLIRAKIVLVLMMLFCADFAYAVWYQVEVIVFENIYPESDGEFWYKTPDLVPLKNTVELTSYYDESENLAEQPGDEITDKDVLIPYGILPSSNHRLEGIFRVLRLSREYRPLYHVSWQQPGLEGNSAKLVHLQSENGASLFELTMPPLLATNPMPQNFYEPIKLIADGTVRIRSSLYLHVDLDMVLFRAPPVHDPEQLLNQEEIENITNSSSDNFVEYVRLTESRRIKLNEMHYFDHPLFGVIIQVSRYGN